MTAGTVIIVVILALAAALAVRSAAKHLKGKGGCCGGGDELSEKEPDKVLEGSITGRKKVIIQGMHCENCAASVKRAINKLDGASAQVNLERGEALVLLDRPVSSTAIRMAVENLSYKVVSIEDIS